VRENCTISLCEPMSKYHLKISYGFIIGNQQFIGLTTRTRERKGRFVFDAFSLVGGNENMNFFQNNFFQIFLKKLS
jgi:hypothetical protein